MGITYKAVGLHMFSALNVQQEDSPQGSLKQTCLQRMGYIGIMEKNMKTLGPSKGRYRVIWGVIIWIILTNMFTKKSADIT